MARTAFDRDAMVFGLRIRPWAVACAVATIALDTVLTVWLGALAALPGAAHDPAFAFSATIYAFAALFMPLWPMPSCAAILIYGVACAWMVGGAACVLPVCGAWLATLALCARSPRRMLPASALAALAMIGLMVVGPYGIHSLGAPAAGLHAVMCMIAVLVGCVASYGFALAARRDADRDLAYDRGRLRLARQNTELARVLHDTVMNDLSVIGMAADVCRDGAVEADDGADDIRYWDLVHDRSNHAWRSLRVLLDRLRADGDDWPGGSFPGFMTALRRECDAFRIMLDAAGMRGEVVMAGECRAIDVSAAAETLALIRQCRSNVLRHCGGVRRWYALCVEIGRDAIAITQTNTVAVPASLAASRTASPQPLNAGRGLALHRQIVEGYGGRLDCSVRDGVWVLVATIPLHPTLF